MLILAVRASDAKATPVIVALASDRPTRVVALRRHVAFAHNVAASHLLLLSRLLLL